MINIAIDGPAGAGKSTIAKMIAKDLGYIYVDTGAMFRAVGLHMLNKGVDLDSPEAIAAEVANAEVDIKYVDGTQCVMLGGENVESLIRNDRVSDAASKVAVVAEVRSRMLDIQRDIAKKNDVVMDGRDIASKVLPDADLKIYLSASSEVRAERRCREYEAKGIECDFETIKAEIEERDHRDMTRKEAPLVKVDDAIEIDSSYMSADEVADKVKSLLKEIV